MEFYLQQGDGSDQPIDWPLTLGLTRLTLTSEREQERCRFKALCMSLCGKNEQRRESESVPFTLARTQNGSCGRPTRGKYGEGGGDGAKGYSVFGCWDLFTFSHLCPVMDRCSNPLHDSLWVSLFLRALAFLFISPFFPPSLSLSSFLWLCSHCTLDELST